MNDYYRQLRRLDLNLLVLFDALMREKSVSRAARLCFLSQPAMSNALNRLRNMLDDPVLVRTSNGMAPSPRAISLTAPIRSLLNQLGSQLEPPSRFDPGSTDKTFRIALTSYGENVLLPGIVRLFREQAPHARLETLRLGENLPVEELERGSIDLVIGVENYLPPLGKLESCPYLGDRLVCVARKKKRKPGRLTLQKYLQAHHIYPSPLGVQTNVVDNWLDAQGLQREITTTTQSYFVAVRIAADSDYLLSLPERVADALARAYPVDILEPPPGFPSFELRLVWHPLYANEPTMRWLLQLMDELKSSLEQPGSRGRASRLQTGKG
jgi:DNA-binding transcriptional LysR family regulator